jgi:hypothetical protein
MRRLGSRVPRRTPSEAISGRCLPPDDFIQVKDILLTGNSPEERSDTPHNFSSILAVADDSFDRLVRLGEVRWIR